MSQKKAEVFSTKAFIISHFDNEMVPKNVAKGFLYAVFTKEPNFLNQRQNFLLQAGRKIYKRASNTVQDSMVPMGFVPVGWVG
jgi:hypothetical protein